MPPSGLEEPRRRNYLSEVVNDIFVSCQRVKTGVPEPLTMPPIFSFSSSSLCRRSSMFASLELTACRHSARICAEITDLMIYCDCLGKKCQSLGTVC